jgi:hypothetical protein
MNGVAALVRLGAFLDDTLGMEILSVGREGLDPANSCTLVATGKWLSYSVTVNGGFAFLRVALMDRGDEFETLLSISDPDEGWRQIFTIIRNFEREEIKSLSKPLELGGGSGPNGYVFG